MISGLIGTYALVGSMPMVGRMLTTQAQQPINSVVMEGVKVVASDVYAVHGEA